MSEYEANCGCSYSDYANEQVLGQRVSGGIIFCPLHAAAEETAKQRDRLRNVAQKAFDWANKIEYPDSRMPLDELMELASAIAAGWHKQQEASETIECTQCHQHYRPMPGSVGAKARLCYRCWEQQPPQTSQQQETSTCTRNT